MIRIDNNFRKTYAGLIRNVRTEKIRVVRLEPGLYYVARVAKGHGKYLVSVKETDSGIFGNCRQIYGAACPTYDGGCTHIAAAVERMIADSKRSK